VGQDKDTNIFSRFKKQGSLPSRKKEERSLNLDDFLFTGGKESKYISAKKRGAFRHVMNRKK
jgi:hypothetical protein